MGLLRGYGNAIVPQVAAVFIRAFLEAEADCEVKPPFTLTNPDKFCHGG